MKNLGVAELLGVTAITLVAITIGLSIGMAYSIAYAFTLSIVWTWLAVPILGLPPLGLVQAMGLMLVAGCFRGGAKYPEDTSKLSQGEKLKRAAYPLMSCAIAVGMAWVIRGML